MTPTQINSDGRTVRANAYTMTAKDKSRKPGDVIPCRCVRHQLDRTIAARDLAQRMRDEAIAENDRLRGLLVEIEIHTDRLLKHLERLEADVTEERERKDRIIAELKADNAHLAEREVLHTRASEIEREAREKAAREAVEIVCAGTNPGCECDECLQHGTTLERLRKHFGLEDAARKEQGNG